MVQLVQVTINGKSTDIQSDPDTPLLWVLRCELGLTGTKFGCGISVCGACTVLVGDGETKGEPVTACGALVRELAGKYVTTIEGLRGDPVAKALHDAWIECDVVQCGYCQSAQLVAATALLRKLRLLEDRDIDADIDAAMGKIACRCGTFPRIRKAIKRASAVLRKEAPPLDKTCYERTPQSPCQVDSNMP